MRPRRLTVIGAVVLALAAAPAAGPTTSLTRPGIVRITSVQRNFSRLDFGRRGYSPGDMEITRASLFNRRVRKRPLGSGHLVCVATGGGFRHCDGTYILPAGKIVVSGALVYRDFYRIAVTGGTGIYNNVRGMLVVTRLSRSENLLIFRLVIA